MVIVDASFERLNGLLKKEISLEELEETLANMGLELDETDGDEIKIEITAERVDLISPEGLARAIDSYRGLVKGYKEIVVNKSDYVHEVESSVKEVRPYTRSFVVKNVELTDENIKSLMWIQEKIHDTYGRKRKKVSIGVYDFNKIKFPVKYCAKKPKEIKFIPLEMDKELNGKEILELHPKGKNYAHLLERFDKYPLQIDSSGQVLSLPPIINSNNLGKVDTETTNLFVECTGPDEESLDSTMNILATMFYDWKGEIYSVIIKSKDKETLCPSLKERKKEISTKFVNKFIGIKLKKEEVVKLLPKMGYNIVEKNHKQDKDNKQNKENKSGDKIIVSIPSVRTDIWHQVDIADDIARAYGYNNIKPTLPNISTIGKMLPENILIENLCNFLVGLDLIEVKTFALTNHDDQYVKMNVEESEHIKLGKNTQDKDLSMVRSWLIPEAIKSLVANRSKEFPQKIFEAGIVVIPDSKIDVKARNVNKLVCLLSEDKVDFTKIKQVLDSTISFLDLKYSVKEAAHNSFIPGRFGNIVIDNEEIGIIGEISPQVLDNWDLKMPLAVFEINLSKIIKILEL